MRAFTAVGLICAVAALCVCGNSLSAVDDPTAAPRSEQQGATPRAKNRSAEKAVVRNVVYGLEQEDRNLYLTSQPLDGDDRDPKRTELKFVVPEGGEVKELSLASMGEKNLVAVVKVRRAEAYEFHCFTFIGPWGGGHVRDKHTFFKAKFYTTRDDLRILAVGGKHFAGSPFIVLGELDTEFDDEPVTVTKGVFYFTGCPWPPSGGALMPFQAKSVPPKDNE